MMPQTLVSSPDLPLERLRIITINPRVAVATVQVADVRYALSLIEALRDNCEERDKIIQRCVEGGVT